MANIKDKDKKAEVKKVKFEKTAEQYSIKNEASCSPEFPHGCVIREEGDGIKP